MTILKTHILWLSVIAFIFSLPAMAENSARDQARQIYEEGAQSFAAGDHATALELLQRSYELFPSLRTLYSIGLCQHALNDFPAALRSLTRYLDEGGDNVPPSLRQRATELIETIRNELEAVAEPSAETVVDVPEPATTVVRVFALKGARAEGRFSGTAGHLRSHVIPMISIATGVILRAEGLVVTAAHVVHGADAVALIIPGVSAPVYGRVVHSPLDHDLAFIETAREVTPFYPLIPQAQAPPDETIEVWVYSTDLTDSRPRSIEGRITRVTHDGRVELALPIETGELGGPVIDSQGRLLGVVSQILSRERCLMDPVESFAARVEAWSARGTEARGLDQAVQNELAWAVASLAQQNTNIPLETILSRWVPYRDREPLHAVAATVFALQSYTLWLTTLERFGVAETVLLPEDVRWSGMQLASLASNLAERARLSRPLITSRYPALSVIAELGGQQICGVRGEACCSGTCEEGLRCQSGRCTAPIEPTRPGERRGWFHLGVSGGMIFDDHPRASALGGGAGSLLLFGEIRLVGTLRPLRLSLITGLHLTFGSFRKLLAVTALLDVGLKLAVGSPRVAGVLTLLYNLGVVSAEERNAFAYASYRVLLGCQISRATVGFGYGETGRGADSTYRELSLYFDWAF